MKMIKTKIPNNTKRSDFMLLHKEQYDAIREYILESHQWEDVEELLSEVDNEFSAMRRL